MGNESSKSKKKKIKTKNSQSASNSNTIEPNSKQNTPSNKKQQETQKQEKQQQQPPEQKQDSRPSQRVQNFTLFDEEAKTFQIGHQNHVKSTDKVQDIKDFEWKLQDSIYIFSNSMNEYLPGIIIEIDQERKEIVVQFWDIQSLEIKYKIIPFNFDSQQIKQREYSSKNDPWDMPINVEDKLSDDNLHKIKQSVSDIPDDVVINEWFVKFRKYLKEKKNLRKSNPFIRLISSYLSENVNGWMDILIKFIKMMHIFESTTKIDEKINVLFDILNVGSEHIDSESLQIVCIMYAKCMMNNMTQTNQDKPENDKERITELALKLLEQIIEEDDEIDIKEFKGIIQNSKAISNIINVSVHDVVLTERSIIPTNQ